LTGCLQSPTCTSSSVAQTAAGPTFPNALGAIPSGGTASAVSLQFMDPNLRTPYSEQGNLTLQRQLLSDLGISVSYLWSHGVQLYGVRDLNLPSATTNFTYTIDDTSGNPVGSYTTPVLIGNRPDTRYGGIYLADNGVTSSYNGLAVQVNKRFKHGFQALASYTWSHEIDDGQSYGESTNNLFLSNANYWLYNGNYKADRGNGTLDQRHRFVLSWVWAPVFNHRADAFNKYVVNGWQLSTITSMASGHPYGSETISLKDTPVAGMFSNFNLDGSGLSGRVPFLPYNSYYLPAMYRADARISKAIPIGERVKASLMLEVFNIANTWAARGYTSSQGYTETKGILTPTPQNLYIPSSDAVPPDGTEARRMQIALRISF
jgi:hypothetical protein